MNHTPDELNVSLPPSRTARLSLHIRQLLRFVRRYPLGIVGMSVLALVTIVALFPDFFAPHDPLLQNLRAGFSPPSLENPLGTDEFGRDILSRLIFGARISLMIAVGANLIAGTAGVLLGLHSGYRGGATDFIEMRLLDIFLSFPGILLAIALVAILGPGLFNITVAVALFSFPIYARVTRSVILSLREQDFILAAVAAGATDTRIIIKHVLPNAIGSVLVILCISVADALLTASSLSFLGLGAPPSVPEWGSMLNGARPYMLSHPYLMLFPGLAIGITVMGFNLVSQMITDFSDPFERHD